LKDWESRGGRYCNIHRARCIAIHLFYCQIRELSSCVEGYRCDPVAT